MQFKKLANNGWFVGSFDQAPYQTDLAEVCYRKETQGTRQPHYHTRCTEIILIVSGVAKINDRLLSAGDIVILEPGEINHSEYLEDTEVVCVKTPAGGQDKVLV